MTFFADKSRYTHKGSFYGIPVYLNLTDIDDPIVEGTNLIFDKLLTFMSYFHSYVIEFGAQMLSAMFGKPYEAGFPFLIKDEIHQD